MLVKPLKLLILANLKVNYLLLVKVKLLILIVQIVIQIIMLKVGFKRILEVKLKNLNQLQIILVLVQRKVGKQMTSTKNEKEYMI